MSTTAENIAVMQAFEDGKVVEWACKRADDGGIVGRWTNFMDDCKSGKPCWDFEEFAYRVKPEPVVRWFNVYSDGWFGGFNDGYRSRMKADDESVVDRTHVLEIDLTNETATLHKVT